MVGKVSKTKWLTRVRIIIYDPTILIVHDDFCIILQAFLIKFIFKFLKKSFTIFYGWNFKGVVTFFYLCHFFVKQIRHLWSSLKYCRVLRFLQLKNNQATRGRYSVFSFAICLGRKHYWTLGTFRLHFQYGHFDLEKK